MGYKVAVVGATGNVGREMLAILAERAFPADEVVALASRRSQGTEVSFGDRTLKVQALENYDFAGTDIALSFGGVRITGDVSVAQETVGTTKPAEGATGFTRANSSPISGSRSSGDGAASTCVLR